MVGARRSTYARLIVSPRDCLNMSTIVSTVLIATPPAFLTGWILSKIVFRHISLTRPNTRRRDHVNPSAPVKPSGTTPDKEQRSADGRRVQVLRQKLSASLAETQSLRTEMQLLKEAAAEREQAVLELKRKLKVQLAVPEESMASAPAKQKQFVQMLEERLATHEHHAQELRHELEVVKNRSSRATQRSRKWRQKFKPMARQFRQQRKMISELRDELRRRDLEQQRLAEAQSSVPGSALGENRSSVVASTAVSGPGENVSADRCPESAVRASAVSVSDVATMSGNEENENLQALKGIGPALHRKLNEKGIYRLRQIALMSPQELHKVGKSLGISKKLLVRHAWIEQARLMLNMPSLSARDQERVEA
jgi:predicted flap endonuclease-1-like 5' DNA nuclease